MVKGIRHPHLLFTKKLSRKKTTSMIVMVTDDEAKTAIFYIGDDKAPSADGFTAKFFKETWQTIGRDICDAVQDFITNG